MHELQPLAAHRPSPPQIVLLIGLPAVILFALLATVDWLGQATSWVNAHWTIAGAIATLAAALAARNAPREERVARGLIALGMASWLVGQLCWNVQTAIDLFSVPAPSDIGFLLSAAPVTLALIRYVHGRLPRAEVLAVYFDAAAIFLTITALVVAIYGEELARAGMLTAAVALLYPIVHIGTAGAGLVALVAAGLRPSLRGAYLVLAGFALLGVAWLEWLRMAVIAPPPPGSPINAVFSVAVLLVGLGGATLSETDSIRSATSRFSRLVLGGMPLVALVVSSVLLAGRRLAWADLGLVDLVAVAVILLAGVRQTLLVHERGALLQRSREARRELEVALEQRAEADSRYRLLVEQVPAAVYIDVADETVTDGGRLAYLSPRIEAILGYPADAFVSDPELWPSLIHAQDQTRALAEYELHWQTGHPLRTEYRMIARDSSEVWVRDEAFAMAERSADGRRVSQGLLVDITQQKRLEARLIHDALHDPLTGLANRALFSDHLERALGRMRRDGVPVAVLFLDLDDFKTVNDSLGHQSGDRLLIEIAKRLVAAVRAGDGAARLGGDEFTVLLPAVTGVDDATRAAERLAAAIGRPIELDGRSLVVGASIGIVVADDPSTPADDVLAHADAAMYAAKADGRGGLAVFDPSMRERATRRLEVETELRAALEASPTQLFLQYQPIFDFETGLLDGIEALVRWRHPMRGIVPPIEFIPHAERSGLIIPLGRWVMREACRQGATWLNDDRLPASVSIGVNVSVQQLHDPGFVDDVREALASSGLPPTRLVIEVTESVLGDVDRTSSRLAQLKAVGVRLAIDDFGTGYSSLSYISRYPVDVIKIDRSFVSAAREARTESAVMEAIIRLARELDIETIAEGVETDEQRATLRAMGCRLGQGYLMGRPMDAQLITGLVDDLHRGLALSSAPVRFARSAPGSPPGLLSTPNTKDPDRRTGPGSIAGRWSLSRRGWCGSSRSSRRACPRSAGTAPWPRCHSSSRWR
jgi:diguanylate cyclase (GGDEF)-like protein/PAS domain S-box-containing protein